ncbi:MAG: xylulokinase [Roseiarcus sp.]|jgi:xylulokinase
MSGSAFSGDAFLGLDIGTSSVKAVLVDERQSLLGEVAVPLSVSRPRPLWSEQNPADWSDAVLLAFEGLRRDHPAAFSRLAGVGLSGQMHGAVLLGAGDEVLRPAILWNDGRAFAECAELERRAPQLRERAGNIAMPGFTAPKLLWVARHEAEIFRATRRVLLPKDYVRLILGGEHVSEMSDASGTLWLDIARRRWDDDLLAATGLGLRHMPRLVEGSAVSSFLSPELAGRWGLAGRRIPIAGGAGDNAAAAVGVGAVAAGQGLVSLGTSGVIFAVTDRFVSAPERTLHAFCHALPGRWHGMAVMLSAAASLAWIAGILGRGADIDGLVAEAEAFAADAENVASAPVFLPYLSGERTPHNDAAATGLFAGLRAEHAAGALAYAVMEGVAFSFADGAAVLDAAGARPTSTMIVGGGARSMFWGRMIADATGLAIDLAEGAEAGAALGAARLAMVAAGAGDEAAICKRPTVQQRFAPREDRAALSAPRLRRYRALYAGEKGARG